ncbi:MAG: 4'-phosphopantetheinyl transferase family protein [Limisphaerales bacterium]
MKTELASAPPASQPPTANLTLSDQAVHIWRAALNPPPERLRHLAVALSPDERDRAARFHFERDRDRFVAGRALLRTILAAYLECKPEQVEFVYGLRGKPYLAPACNADGWQFNLAHADGRALLGVTRHHEIGIDLERVRLLHDMHQLAARFFSIAECGQLRTIPWHQQAEAFFNGWTRKEAYLKATGTGIAEMLHRIEVSLVPGVPPRLLSTDHDPSSAARWTIMDVDFDAGHKAALAVRTPNISLVYRTWTS